MNSEKKIKLEDLPDEGRSSVQQGPFQVARKKLKQENEPRVEKLKKLSDEGKVQEMTTTWYFDRPEYTFGWLAFVLLLFAAEYSGFYDAYLIEKMGSSDNTMGLSEAFSGLITMYFEKIIQHPTVFLLLTPLFFRLRKPSPYHFSVNFDGLSTVKGIATSDGGAPIRKFIKWNEVSSIVKGLENKRNVLIVNSLEGRTGVLIWDINNEKKKAIQLLIRGLLAPKHPFREFLEKEKM